MIGKVTRDSVDGLAIALVANEHELLRRRYARAHQGRPEIDRTGRTRRTCPLRSTSMIQMAPPSGNVLNRPTTTPPASFWNVHIGGGVIRTTFNHPWYVLYKGWVPAAKLEIDDRLVHA